MISPALVALSVFALSAAAVEIQSLNSAFFNAGIQGCISVANNTDGSPVVIHDCNTEAPANQDWKLSFFTRQPAGPQPITIFGNKCIDVTNGVNADGTKLQIWTCVPGSTNQQFISLNDFTLQWAGTNKCIDLSDGKITDGNQLQIWTCDSKNSNQGWVGEPNPFTTQPVHIISDVDDTNAPDGLGPYCITAASDADGAEVALANCANDFHTTFPNGNITWLAPVAPLSGTIKTFNNKCLDVPNGSTTNGVKLQIWTCAAGNTNQMFTNHRGQVEWKGKGKCLDLTDGKLTNGNPIQLWDCVVPDNNLNQDWTTESI